MNNKSVFLSNLFYFYAKTDGTYTFPNSSEGDLLKTAKKEIEELEYFRRDVSKILDKVIELENENAELRAVAVKLIANNGGPLQSEEQVERDSVDDYIMIKLQDFEALCAAIDAAKKEAGDDAIMQQHLNEGGTPT